MPPEDWTLRLAHAARDDLLQIQSWTSRTFGPEQARVYAATLSAALNALRAGPSAVGARRREELGKNIYALHVARQGRKGRHFIVFRPHPHEHRVLDVLRILHDGMDLQRHVGEPDA